MKNDDYYLDGKENGIIAIDPSTGNPIKGLGGKYVYENKHILLSYLEKTHVKNYELVFILKGQIIPYSKVMENLESYQCFLDDTVVNIFPQVENKLVACGYFSFDDNPTELIQDFETGLNVNYNNYSMVLNAISHMIRSGKLLKRENDIYGKYCYRIPGTTIALRVLKCNYLVKENEFRREAEVKVLPFDKNMDRFKNVYWYFSKDMDDTTNDIETNKKISSFLQEIDNYINNNYGGDAHFSINRIKVHHFVKL